MLGQCSIIFVQNQGDVAQAYQSDGLIVVEDGEVSECAGVEDVKALVNVVTWVAGFDGAGHHFADGCGGGGVGSFQAF